MSPDRTTAGTLIVKSFNPVAPVIEQFPTILYTYIYIYKVKKGIKKKKRNAIESRNSDSYKFYNIGNRNHTVKYNPIFICIMCINVADTCIYFFEKCHGSTILIKKNFTLGKKERKKERFDKCFTILAFREFW